MFGQERNGLLAVTDSCTDVGDSSFVGKKSCCNGWPPGVDTSDASLDIIQGGADQIRQTFIKEYKVMSKNPNSPKFGIFRGFSQKSSK